MRFPRLECPHEDTDICRRFFFEETSNAPASFAAARAALGVAALKGFNASLRDAETAYLQAVIDTLTRIPTFVELPREWWPDSWFKVGAKRQIPKYDRPHCRLLKALYGPPKLEPFGRFGLTIL